jgi:hypothetical protein
VQIPNSGKPEEFSLIGSLHLEVALPTRLTELPLLQTAQPVSGAWRAFSLFVCEPNGSWQTTGGNMESIEQALVNAVDQQDSFEEPGSQQQKSHDHDPERRLWTAVLLQAVMDFQSHNMRARREAEIFLMERPADLEAICHRAGMNPVAFQSKLRRLSRSKPLAGLPRMVMAA